MSLIMDRPWGSWEIVYVDDKYVVKVLTVNPGCMLSLQSHNHRSESWAPMEDGLIKYVLETTADETPSAVVMSAGRSYHIDKGQVHRLINPTGNPISVIETITGAYDENDITRYHDAYGRAE